MNLCLIDNRHAQITRSMFTIAWSRTTWCSLLSATKVAKVGRWVDIWCSSQSLESSAWNSQWPQWIRPSARMRFEFTDIFSNPIDLLQSASSEGQRMYFWERDLPFNGQLKPRNSSMIALMSICTFGEVNDFSLSCYSVRIHPLNRQPLTHSTVFFFRDVSYEWE